MEKKDNRSFIRCESKSMCEVTFDSETFRGIVIDYSDGVCVIIRDSPFVVKGARAKVQIIDMGIEIDAEIEWSQKDDFNFVKIGFKNLGSFRGDIKHYRISHLLSGIQKKRISGILELKSDSVSDEIYIKNGMVRSAELVGEYESPEKYLDRYAELKEGSFELEEKEVIEEQKVGLSLKSPALYIALFLIILTGFIALLANYAGKKTVTVTERTSIQRVQPPSFHELAIDRTGIKVSLPYFHKGAIKQIQVEENNSIRDR